MTERSEGRLARPAGAVAAGLPGCRTCSTAPVVGVASWIVMSLLAGPDRFELAVGLALGIAVAVLLVLAGLLRGEPQRLLELADVTFFGGWITTVGVLVLVFDGGPAGLGVALIVPGVLLVRALAPYTAEAERSGAGAAG